MKLKHSEYVVCNTTPLLYLHQLGILQIIPRICENILIPPAVVRELKAGKEQGVDVPDVAEYSWIQVKSPRSVSANSLIRDLGDGETEVLLLALEHQGSLVILDDNLARRYAELNKIPVVGTCGLLLKAKSCGIIPRVSSLLSQLENKGFYLSNDLKEIVIRLANE